MLWAWRIIFPGVQALSWAGRVREYIFLFSEMINRFNRRDIKKLHCSERQLPYRMSQINSLDNKKPAKSLENSKLKSWTFPSSSSSNRWDCPSSSSHIETMIDFPSLWWWRISYEFDMASPNANQFSGPFHFHNYARWIYTEISWKWGNSIDWGRLQRIYYVSCFGLSQSVRHKSVLFHNK